jgi:hypothetical protein
VDIAPPFGIKQKNQSTLAKNRKSNRLASSVQPQIQKPIKAGEALDRYVDKKSIPRPSQTVKIIEFHLDLVFKMITTNQNAFAVSSRRIYASGIKKRNFL